MKKYINALVDYALSCGLIEPADRIFAQNALLEIMELKRPEGEGTVDLPLSDILAALTDNAVQRGIIEDGISSRDLFDTRLMGALTPFPRELRHKFSELYKLSPKAATDWYYSFSQDTNYIRRDRIKRDIRWKYAGKYGELDITVNLSKPEKDPRAIAAARSAPQNGYPLCQLCAENEGYAGRLDHPARQNHRIIPVKLCGEEWFLQYSPYVYYNEHCIVFNPIHTPMKIDLGAMRRLLDFVSLFPHYFIGSNADLPIVGGSILSHDHFQGGCYEFPMARAQLETELRFRDFEDVQAGIVNWPMSVIRLSSPDRERLAVLGDRILTAWRGYTDREAFILAETDGEPHNTVTPIARRRGEDYELDLVLRNNITTHEHPLGVFHPHEKLHHIKKENIGLIEVMGLAVLPSRLRSELALLADAILSGADIRSDERIAKHADWAEELCSRHSFNSDNIDGILKAEVGSVFQEVLEDAGVFKRSDEGQAAFMRFAGYVNTFPGL